MKIVESVNKYNKKINNKIAKLDTNDEDYDNKLANLNSQKVYSNFSTRK